MNDKRLSRPKLATKYRRLLTLRTKMLLAFGSLFVITGTAAVLAGLYGLPLTGFRGEFAAQREDVFTELNLIADMKKERLQRWIAERKADAAVLSRNKQLSADVIKLRQALRGRTYSQLPQDEQWLEVQRLDEYRNLHQQLSIICSAYSEYQSVSIADWSTFEIIASSNPEELGRIHPSPQRSDSQLIVNSRDAFIGDILIDENSDQAALHIAAPVWSQSPSEGSDREVVGLLVFQVSPDEVINPILNTGGGLGKSGEVFLVNRNRQTLVNLKCPLPDGSAATPLVYSIEAKPATLAAQGKEGLIASLDYRGVPVLAAYRHLRVSPEVGWGMVVKMDQAEVWASLNKILKYTYSAGIFIAVLVLTLIVLISRHLSRPIAELARVAGEVQTGNLNTRAPASSNDEIGLLGRAFNSMIEQINQWHNELEDKVEARTQELKTTIKELSREIGRRKQAQEALKESEALYHSLVDTSQDLIWKCDTQDRFIFLNEPWEKTHGYPLEEMLGKPFKEFQTPEAAKRDAEEFGRHLAGGSVAGYETTHISKSGATIHLVFNAVPLLDKAGNIVGTQGTAYDITERKKAEEALRDSETVYRRTIENASGVPYQLDLEGNRYVFIGNGIEDLVGVAPEEFSPDIYSEMLVDQIVTDPSGPEDHVAYGNDFRRGTVGQYRSDVRIRTPHGDVKWVSDSAVPIRDDSGQVIGSLGILMDITERKLAAAVLESSISLLEATLESTADGILVVNHEGKVIRFNQRFLELWTIPQDVADTQDDEKLLGHVLSQLKYPDRFIAKVKDLYANPEASSIDVLEFRDGRVFERFSLPQKIGDKIVGRVWSFRDITETKRLQKLEARAQRLETAGQIAGQVAHDFNNLLAPMLAYPEFIREELSHDHPALPFLSDIEKGAKQIAEINQQLLTLGRRGHYNQEPLNLNTIVNDAVKEITPLPEKLSVETLLSPDLMNIMGGSAQLQRVLSNLINNACDAMRDDGKITISTENYYVDDVSVAYGRVPRGEYVKLTISDTGHGIPEEVAQQVFDPFFTTKTADKRRGSGLGLSVVDAVIRDHNGYIDLSSKPNEGTSFYLYFPITRDTVDKTGLQSIEGGTETMLVVDDDQVQREVSTKLLEVLGYKVSSVGSGEQAIDFIKENPQDLLVLDMIMQTGIDGAETYRRAIEINPAQKAIIVSGSAESDRVQLAMEMGAGSFVRKPLTRRVLAAAVRRELDKRPILSIS